MTAIETEAPVGHFWRGISLQAAPGRQKDVKVEKVHNDDGASSIIPFTMSSKPKAATHKAKSLKSPPKKKSPKKAPNKKKEAPFDTVSMDVVLPTALLESSSGNKGECSVLVQIDPQDATRLDFEGQTGAIGRFESDSSGVTLDLKGFQYHGTIHPGPTALVVSVLKSGELKVDGMTDEFVTLKQTQDIMAKLNAVVKGDMDEGYAIEEEDVNVRSKVIDEALAASNPTKKRKKKKN